MDKPYKILVKFATRGRPERFFKTMESIFSTAKDVDNIHVIVTADIDDKAMCNDEVVRRVGEYKNTRIIFGTSTSKIDAINRDMDILPNEIKDWDILSNVSDDMVYVAFGWDEYLRTDMFSLFGNTDGYLSYLDPDTKGALTTQMNIGRQYYERFGFIYNPAYLSLFCDNEADEVAKLLGKYRFTNNQIFHHFNPAYNYQEYPKDDQFLRQQELGWTIDAKTYQERKQNNFDIHLYN